VALWSRFWGPSAGRSHGPYIAAPNRRFGVCPHGRAVRRWRPIWVLRRSSVSPIVLIARRASRAPGPRRPVGAATSRSPVSHRDAGHLVQSESFFDLSFVLIQDYADLFAEFRWRVGGGGGGGGGGGLPVLRRTVRLLRVSASPGAPNDPRNSLSLNRDVGRGEWVRPLQPLFALRSQPSLGRSRPRVWRSRGYRGDLPAPLLPDLYLRDSGNAQSWL